MDVTPSAPDAMFSWEGRLYSPRYRLMGQHSRCNSQFVEPAGYSDYTDDTAEAINQL